MRCHCYDCENVGSCDAVGVGERRERAAIAKWLRSCPTTCECKENGGEACRFSDPMSNDELADAIEKGEHL